MFTKHSDSGYRTAMAGVAYRTLAHGGKTHLTEFRLDKGSLIPSHTHPHEQTGYLVSGRMTFFIEGERHETLPGDAWNIAGGVAHRVEVQEDCVVVEVFSPPREDYLP